MTVHCQNCEAAYSDDFARVFGNNDNQLVACPDCEDVTAGDLGYGVAAGLDMEARISSRGGAL